MDFWIFLSVMSGFTVLTRRYLTLRRVGPYGEVFFMNLGLGTIPMKFFSYGSSLVNLTIIFWEYLKRKEEREGRE
jgi:hypothetical protein